jgi:type IV pilus assembly protein PilM
MALLNTKREKSMVGLDVEAGSVAATQIRVNGRAEVVGYGVAPLPPGVFREGEVVDAEALGATLKTLFSEHKLSRDVRFGVANQRVVVRTLTLPRIEDADELATAIRFQAQDHIPMPVEQAILDWEVIGHTHGPNGEPQIQVVVVAARRDMVSSVIKAMRIGGLQPQGIDLSAFGMIRALSETAPPVAAAPAQSYEERVAGAEPGVETGPVAAGTLYCNLGDVLNLAVANGTYCRFTRISPFGIEGIAQKLAERRALTLEHARQWLAHVGLVAPIAEIEGDAEIVSEARSVLESGVAKLVDELRLSLEYYASQDGAVPVQNVIACGPGTTIPGLVQRLQESVAYPFSVGRPGALAAIDDATAARLTLSFGLALDS